MTSGTRWIGLSAGVRWARQGWMPTLRSYMTIATSCHIPVVRFVARISFEV